MTNPKVKVGDKLRVTIEGVASVDSRGDYAYMVMFHKDAPVVGAWPGTPAAKSQEQHQPLVLKYGDPAPDRSKKFRDTSGDLWWFSNLIHGWTVADPGSENLSAEDDAWEWSGIVARWFPMTEVME